MITVCHSLAAPETAHALRLALGPARAWANFLADCIRGRTSFEGLLLMPYASTKGGTGEVARPLYRPADILEFIELARKRDPALRPARPTANRIEVDANPGLHWRARVARPAPHPPTGP